MPGFEEELRLLSLLIVNAIVCVGAWRFTRRVSGNSGATQRAIDTILLWYATQYVAAGLPALVHCLTNLTMLATGTVAGIAMWVAGTFWQREQSPAPLGAEPSTKSERYIAVAALMFAIGFELTYAWNQRLIPVLETDPLVYHFPVALHWIHQKTFALYDIWYWLQANTYSPMGGTIFTVWLYEPLGNDVLARRVQLPAVLLILLVAFRIGRSLRLNLALAAIVAAAAVVARPLTSQAMIPKDDIFAAAFFLVVVASCDLKRLRDPLAPWRLGIALGLYFSTKYTVMLIAPAFLLLIDAPFRAGWRWTQWTIAAVVAFVCGAPWYLRNWIEYKNPVYPVDVTIAGHRIFEGQFSAGRNDMLKSFSGAWDLLATTYHSLPSPVLIPAVTLLAIAIVLNAKRTVQDPLLRMACWGTIFATVLFIAKAPLAGVRYMFPVYVMLFVAAGVALSSIRLKRVATQPYLSWSVAIALLLVAAATSFVWSNVSFSAEFSAGGVVCAAMGVGAFALHRYRPQFLVNGLVVAGIVVALVMYVYWRPFLGEYEATTNDALASYPGYQDIGPAWVYVRTEIPADKSIAYANTYLTYPLFGFHGDRRVVYAPVRPGLHQLSDLPRVPDDTKPDDIMPAVWKITNSNADGRVWIDNLKTAGAEYLFVVKKTTTDNPPELLFAAEDAAMFEKVFEAENAVVFRINWAASASKSARFQ